MKIIKDNKIRSAEELLMSLLDKKYNVQKIKKELEKKDKLKK